MIFFEWHTLTEKYHRWWRLLAVLCLTCLVTSCKGSGSGSGGSGGGGGGSPGPLRYASLSISDGTTYNYGTRATGSTTTKVFTITNSGNASGTINLVTNTALGLSAPYAINAGSTTCATGTILAINGTCNIAVDFSPVAVGVASATINLSYNNSIYNTRTTRDITGTGAAPASLTISDGATYSYGVKNLNTTTTKVFTVTNGGGVAATLGTVSTVGLALAAPFTLNAGLTTCATSGTVNAAATCDVAIDFNPTAIGSYSDTITLDYNNGASNTNTTRAITGSTPAILTLSECGTYDFGNKTLLSTTTKSFTVTNSGGSAATLGTVSTVGLSLAAPFTLNGGSTTCATSGTVNAGATCVIAVDFTPTAANTLYTDTISLSYNDGIGAQTADRPVQGVSFTSSQIWQLNAGSINALALSGTTLYIGGSFSTLTTTATYGSMIDTTTAYPLNQSWAYSRRINGLIRAVISDGSGGFYIGGSFTQIGTSTRNYIAHINSDGSLDAWDPNANGDVYTMVISGGDVCAGGSFTQIGGAARNYIGCVKASGLASTWDPNSNGDVYVLALTGTTIYAGGNFTNIGGAARNYIAALDTTVATNNALAWNPNADGIVYALVPSATDIYVGGAFTNIGGAARNYIAFLNNVGGAYPWNPNSDSTVYSLVLDGTTLYAGGNFTNIGGAARNYIASLDTTIDTNNANNWNPNADTIVRALAINGTTMYAAGDFANIGGAARNGLAALDTTVINNNALAWNPTPSNGANLLALAVSGTTVYAGGSFSTLGSITRNNVAAINLVTGVPTTWNPNADGAVNSLALSGSTVYAGGQFANIGGAARTRIAAIDNTGVATAWNPVANATVSALSVYGSTVYAGGSFTNIGGAARNYIAALDNTGAATAWNPNADAAVKTVQACGTSAANVIYAGGSFTNIGGSARNYIAALDPTTNTSNATTWNPGANAAVNTLLIDGSTIYAGGSFTTLGGSARSYIGALDSTNNATSWNAQANAAVTSLSISSTTVYAGGTFTTIGGAGRTGLAGLDTTINLNNATSWNPSPDVANISALVTNGKAVYTSGPFSKINTINCQNLCSIDPSADLPF